MTNDPVQERIQIVDAEMQTRTILPSPSTVEVETAAQADETFIDPVQARIKNEMNLIHARAEIQRADNNTAQVAPDAPDGMTPEALAEIAKGNPDPEAPLHPIEISPIKEMSLPMLQQYVQALEAKLSHLTTRFENLISENFTRGNY